MQQIKIESEELCTAIREEMQLFQELKESMQKLFIRDDSLSEVEKEEIEDLSSKNETETSRGWEGGRRSET